MYALDLRNIKRGLGDKSPRAWEGGSRWRMVPIIWEAVSDWVGKMRSVSACEAVYRGVTRRGFFRNYGRKGRKGPNNERNAILCQRVCAWSFGEMEAKNAFWSVDGICRVHI